MEYAGDANDRRDEMFIAARLQIIIGLRPWRMRRGHVCIPEVETSCGNKDKTVVAEVPLTFTVGLAPWSVEVLESFNPALIPRNVHSKS